ncbi:MAG: ester cyclase [Methyloligellaceae bacterium]
MTADPKTLVERFYAEVWNQADEAVAHEILHPSLSFKASLGPVRTGPDGFIAYLRSVHAALDGFRCIIEELIATEDRAAARMTFVGTHRAEFFGVAATGRQITWSGGAFFRVDGGQIAEIWILGDIDAVKSQLGAEGAAAFDG